VTLTRVVDEAELDQVWESRAVKMKSGSEPRPAGWWTFRAVSR
jgi:hypothetical protein